MGLLSNSVAAHPYQNQTWAPRGWHTRIWVRRACLSLETRNHCEGSFSHRKRCPFWPFLEIVLEKYNLFSLNLECNSRVCNGPIFFFLKIWPMFTWAGMWLCNLVPMHPGGGTPIETLYGALNCFCFCFLFLFFLFLFCFRWVCPVQSAEKGVWRNVGFFFFFFFFCGSKVCSSILEI